MRVVVQKIDLDTCMTALIMGVGPEDDAIVAVNDATADDLADPSVLCIEAGGSGQVALNNFDHHEPGGPVRCASEQAQDVAADSSLPLSRLVAYGAAVDLGRWGPSAPLHSVLEGADAPLSLSALFSGMRLAIQDPRAQFFTGVDLLRTVLADALAPFDAMPSRPEWATFEAAKREERTRLVDLREHAEIFATISGAKAGFIATTAIGALGLLYSLDCDVAIAYSPAAPRGDAVSAHKFTIGGRNGRRVDQLLPFLNALEPGWGGPAHGTIIASPRTGTGLDPEVVKTAVRLHA